MADTMIEEMRRGISYWFPSSKWAYILLAIVGIAVIGGFLYLWLQKKNILRKK